MTVTSNVTFPVKNPEI